MRYIILILSCFLAFMCNGQNFLSKYPKLTKKNLSDFFSDWKTYSDSVASLATKNDSLIDMAIGYNYLPQMLEGYRFDKEKYIVIPQYIKIERYYVDLRQGGKTEEINKPNLKRLRKYIPVEYGHWGGYLWFTSFPLITKICQANNLFVIKRRTRWYSGDEIWFIKEAGEFVRRKEAAGKWIE